MLNWSKTTWGIVLALALGWLVPGCRTKEPMVQQRSASADPGAESGSGQASSRVAAAASRGLIPEETLADRGLMTLWSRQPSAAEGVLRSAYLLPEGIFTVTRPRTDVQMFRLARYSRDSGLPEWYYDIDQPLEHAPVAYRYTSSADGSRSPELYILQKDVMRCLDLQHGAEMWRVQLRFPVSCGPVVDERQYYLGSYDRRIYAMPKKRTVEAWTHITGGEIRSPGVLGPGGQVYFTSTDKAVYRLEPTSGWIAGKSWQFNTGARILGSPVFFSRWLFAGSSDYKLYCFEADGTRAWEFPAQSPIYDTPVVMSFRPDKPIAVCLSQDERRGAEKRTAWALDAKTGQELWHRDHVAQVVGIGKRALYLLLDSRPGRAGGDRRIVAVDALKGAELFTLPVEGFQIIPLNDAENGTNPKARGVIYLISNTGLMQAVRERP